MHMQLRNPYTTTIFQLFLMFQGTVSPQKHLGRCPAAVGLFAEAEGKAITSRFVIFEVELEQFVHGLLHRKGLSQEVLMEKKWISLSFHFKKLLNK